MEKWRRVWRLGLAEQLPGEGLEALRVALLANDPCLLQGATTSPPELDVMADRSVEAACAVGFSLWKGKQLTTVRQVSEAFARVCARADKALGEVAVSRFFFDWFDYAPRFEMRRNLLPEVNLVLNERRVESAA